MSDFNTYEVEVIVGISISAYDIEHAFEVARDILLEDKCIRYVKEVN